MFNNNDFCSFTVLLHANILFIMKQCKFYLQKQMFENLFYLETDNHVKNKAFLQKHFGNPYNNFNLHGM